MLAARETFVSIASIESPSSSRIPATCAPAEPPKKRSTHKRAPRAQKQQTSAKSSKR